MAGLAGQVEKHTSPSQQHLERMLVAYIRNVDAQRRVGDTRCEVAKVAAVAGVQAVNQGAEAALVGQGECQGAANEAQATTDQNRGGRIYQGRGLKEPIGPRQFGDLGIAENDEDM